MTKAESFFVGQALRPPGDLEGKQSACRKWDASSVPTG
jgi:hypothetical protein